MSFGLLGLILLGFLLLAVAVLLAFLMVLRILAPTLFLCFASFFLNIGGLVLGFLGLATYVRGKRSGR